MGLPRRLLLSASLTVALFALSGGSASMGASTGTVWKQTGWATIATPRPGVHVQRKQVWVTGYSGPRTITRVAWSIGSSHVSIDAMPLGTYRSGDAGFGGSRISALSGAGGFIAGINGDTFAGGWMCSYCHLHGLLVHDRWIRNFGVRGPEVGFGPSGSMVMGEATAAPVQFLLKGMAVTVGQFGALPSTGNYDQIGIYTSGSQTLPANTYGVVVDATVLSSLLRTSTPRSPMSLHGLGHKEPVQSFRLVEPEAAAVTQSLTIAGAYPAGSHVTLAAGQMLLVGRTGTGGPYAGNALEHTVAYHLPVRVTMSDSGWGTMDDVMDGKYQLVHNGLAQTGRPTWSDMWPWSCMGVGYGCFRTAVGRNGNTGWIAIVGVPHSYGGLTTPDWARVLKTLGATQAMGFDANSAAELYRAGSGSVTNGDGGRIIPSATALRYN